MSKIDSNLNEKLTQMYQKKKVEDELNESSSFELSLKEDKLTIPIGYTVCRILDLPRICDSSFIKCDDDKTRLFKFPSLEEDPNFILYKILNKVIYQVYKGADENGKAIIETPVKEIYPDIFWMVYNNGDMVLGQYGANGWGSWKKVRGKYTGAAKSSTCFMNVINRREYEVIREIKSKDGTKEEEILKYEKDWCVTNKHSLLLSKADNSVGTPITVSNLLIKDIFPNFGNYINYDVAIHRMKKDPYYMLYKASSLVNNAEVYPYVSQTNGVDNPLTEEEKSIEVYDLDEIVKASTYSFIYQNLNKKISMIDEALGTQFSKELEDLMEQENINKPKDSKKEVKKEVKKENKIEEKVVSEEPKKEEIRAMSRVKKSVESENVTDWDKVKNITFKDKESKYIIDKLKDTDKKLIKGVSADGKKLEFTTTDLSACPTCKSVQPTIMSDFCIYCGYTF